MAIFLPFTAPATCTSFGGIAQCVPESNSVDSMSLPSGSLSPTLMVIGDLLSVSLGGRRRMIPNHPMDQVARAKPLEGEWLPPESEAGREARERLRFLAWLLD